MDASSVKTLKPHWLLPCEQAWPQGHNSHQRDAQRWMPHPPSPCALQTLAALQTKTKKGSSPLGKFKSEQTSVTGSENWLSGRPTVQVWKQRLPRGNSSWNPLDRRKSVILQTSEEVLVFTSKKNKDWFDKNTKKIQELQAKKRRSHQAHLSQPSYPVRRTTFRLICSIL